MLCTDSRKIALASQDISVHTHGAYTGEVSASMVAATGAKYTIIGHSECRQYHDDTNATVCDKARLAISNGLTPIICIGETMEEKQAGKTMEIIDTYLAYLEKKRNLSKFRGLKGSWKPIRTLEWNWKRDVTPVPSEMVRSLAQEEGADPYHLNLVLISLFF